MNLRNAPTGFRFFHNTRDCPKHHLVKIIRKENRPVRILSINRDRDYGAAHLDQRVMQTPCQG